MRWRDAAADWLRGAENWAAPLQCSSCHDEISIARRNAPCVCEACAEALSPVGQLQCRRCSAPLGPFLDVGPDCPQCRADQWPFDRVWSVGGYNDSLRSLVLASKRDFSGRLGGALAGLLWDRRGGEIGSTRVDCVIPVPQHWTERWLQPNPAVTSAAERLARFLKQPCERHILMKVKRTAKQAGLTAVQRRNNLRGAFRVVRGVRFESARILLVDDVLTTGTTARRASEALLQSGAESVVVAVLSRTLVDGPPAR